MPPIFRAVLAGFLAIVCSVTVAPAALGKTAQQKHAERAAKHRPMAFFLAKGSANACGKGCSEWIAAEGVFDAYSAKRFEVFLATLKREDLPIYFNSQGGNVSQSVLIGIQLRKRRMTAGIGRTLPAGCTRTVRGDGCHHVMQAKPEHTARLSIDGARCLSACAYAFVGASVRTVGKGAKLGVHSAFPQDGAFDRPGMIAQTHDLLRGYAVEMGVDSGLVDAAASTSSERMRILTREEIARFGIETVSFYETRWLTFQQGERSFNLMKSVTHGQGPDNKQAYSATIHLACGNTFGLLLRYRRELQTDLKIRPAVSLRVEGDTVAFVSVLDQASTGVWSTVAAFRLLEQAAARSTIDIVESYAVAANRDAQTTSISTSGLSEALTTMRKRCGERKFTDIAR